MLPESTQSPPKSWKTIQDALAEIRGIPSATQTFASGVFDHLDTLTRRWLSQEFERRQLQTAVERDGLQQQIDHLASIIGQLSETLSSPRKPDER